MNKTTLDILPLNKWGELKKCKKPLIISGPCSAESREQVIHTAKALAETSYTKVFRAGLWKPRTRPDSFEGVGSKGLKWMQEVKAITGLLTTVEVANHKHIEQCLKHGIDILWLGARTTANPFSVQEIAEALKGVDIPVMIKNPVNPDIKLWFGAIERINRAGIKKIIAIHRGFNTFNSEPYRNAPIWEIPIELMRICKNLPVICDPSHIAGNNLLIEGISQKALDLEMDGLMIETHICPENAISDSRQQISPKELEVLFSKLIIRNNLPEKNQCFHILEQLRSEIDLIDEELIKLLSKRMHIVKQIGDYKKENKITILQIKRWDKIVKKSIDIGKQLGLSKEFLNKLLRVIHEEAIQKQTDIFNKKSKQK